VLDALFPLVCPGCGRTGDPVCARCARELHPAPPAPTPAGLDGWWSAFAYEGVAREVVARVKYRGTRASLRWLAAAVVDALGDHPPDLDLVTWAPTSRDRRRARGFDPAELLARSVARHLGARCLGLLERRPGPPQTGLSGADRRRGPQHVARASVPPTVLVVDDVTTTGATLAAAAGALRLAGAGQVFAATAARTPPPGRTRSGSP
jgi:predicted amidophosphoribosyltransferase